MKRFPPACPDGWEHLKDADTVGILTPSSTLTSIYITFNGFCSQLRCREHGTKESGRAEASWTCANRQREKYGELANLTPQLDVRRLLIAWKDFPTRASPRRTEWKSPCLGCTSEAYQHSQSSAAPCTHS